MEAVLSIYERPFDPRLPVVCMDEKPIQFLRDKNDPIAATINHPKRLDHEYERAGTASIFLFTEPKAGWRSAHARVRRTKTDWAQEVAHVLDHRYADCDKVILVCDNLNTHTEGAFYEVFEPARARRYVEKIEICYTPKHGSWLNIAECELSALERQCLRGRRIASIELLNEEMLAWYKESNAHQKGVDWQFTIGDARIKLKRLYPEKLL